MLQGENSLAASTHGAIRAKLCQVFGNLGSGVICETQALQAAVIPAKAGIHSANLRKCAVYELDSSRRGGTGMTGAS